MPDFPNENIENPVKFQRNNDKFLISVCLKYCMGHIYTKKGILPEINCVSLILPGNPTRTASFHVSCELL